MHTYRGEVSSRWCRSEILVLLLLFSFEDRDNCDDCSGRCNLKMPSVWLQHLLLIRKVLVFLLGLQWYKIMLLLLNFPMFCWVWQLLFCRSQGQLFCPSWSQEQVSPSLLSALSWWNSGLSSEHWWAFGRCQTTVIQDTFHLAHFYLLCHFGFIIHSPGRVNGKTECHF